MKIEDRRRFTRDGDLRDEREPGSAAKDPGASTRDRWVGPALLAVGVLLCVSLYLVSRPAERPRFNPPAQEAAPEPLDRLGAHAACRMAVEQSLKSPRSARFPVESYRKTVEDLGRGRFRHRSYVDAQNSFGAILRTRFVCAVEDDGEGGIRLVRLDFDE